jgi:hypothetical protein
MARDEALSSAEGTDWAVAEDGDRVEARSFAQARGPDSAPAEVQHLASKGDADLAVAEDRHLSRTEVPAEVQHLAPKGDVDLTAAKDRHLSRAKVPALARAQVAEWIPAVDRDLDSAEVEEWGRAAVRDLALAVQGQDFVATEVRMSTRHPRSGGEAREKGRPISKLKSPGTIPHSGSALRNSEVFP